MGKTDPRYVDGWRAFERGESLKLYLGCCTVFARGWLDAMELAIARTPVTRADRQALKRIADRRDDAKGHNQIAHGGTRRAQEKL